MRIVATSDTHKKVDISFIPDGDVFIHAGDLMTTGYVSEWYEQLEWLAALPHKKKIYVPGNHDFHVEVYTGPALQELRAIGVTVLGIPSNQNFYTINIRKDISVLGLPFVKNLPRWAFNSTEEQVSYHLENMPRADIVVSHSPIANILDGYGCGFDCYAEYCELHSPKYWIHGHIHERYGSDVYLDTQVYNVAMCDRRHNHVNPPIVLDI